jgi:aspartyl-tRNA(Asn)/glutamyl-tRNA(Gln) amidotransferase subunit C
LPALAEPREKRGRAFRVTWRQPARTQAIARIEGHHMAIDRKTVDNTALLARLALTEAERVRLQDQLSAILEHIAVLQEADTSQVPATAHVLPLQNVMTSDQQQPCETPETMLANAPAREDDYIRVRAVLEE